MRTVSFEVEDDEPVALLRASDPCAPQALEAWGDGFRVMADKRLNDSNHGRLVSRAAVSLAGEMIEWRRNRKTARLAKMTATKPDMI